MEPEKLKVIAEGMPDGRPVEIDEDGCVWYVNYPPTTTVGSGYKVFAVQYNPLTNNDQCMEIMEKLHTWVTWPFHKHSCEILISKEGKSYIGKGKTINEAVCNAAYEYFKEDV